MSTPITTESSAQLLAAMTDTGRFERLATAILRSSTPDYRNLVHVGISPSGKPIAAPVDGVGPSASGPQRLVLVQHTTTQRSGLSAKWLHAKEGDVQKALLEVEKARAVVPDLPCTLILTTTSTPTVNVVTKAAALTTKAGVNLDIWEVKRLADFLDHEPTGQELRFQYFGVPRTLLSMPVLRQFSLRSVTALEASALDDPSCWVTTDVDELLQERVSGSRPLTFLSMPSGAGKTALVVRLLRRHVEAGGIGAWVSAEVINDARSPESALSISLGDFMPNLGPDNLAERAIALTDPTRPLLLVIDDITHCAQGELKIRSLLNWALMVSARASANGTNNLRVVCPVPSYVLQSMFWAGRVARGNCPLGLSQIRT